MRHECVAAREQLSDCRVFQVSADPNVANPTGSVILSIAQPFANHYGGWIGFGPDDGYLYIAMGDGGDGGEAGERAQTLE